MRVHFFHYKGYTNDGITNQIIDYRIHCPVLANHYATKRFIQEGNQCRRYPYKETGLSRLSCNGAEALLYEQVPLLFSNADYNLPNVQVVNRFSINKQHYYTVMLALKAYTAYGILFQEHEKWRFIVKKADWATLC